jgi:hypothetical protein
MKSREEIEKSANEFSKDYIKTTNNSILQSSFKLEVGYIKGYTQCQEDTAELLKAEIRRAYIHGQGNAQGMAAGLERDEVEDYTNWRMLSLTKK